MRRLLRIFLFVFGLILLALLGACIAWTWKRPLAPAGGFYFAKRLLLPVPPFQQNDPRWGHDFIGSGATADTMGAEGCAVSSAAMVLDYYGAVTNPQQLNWFLTVHNGYTPQGWLYWERAADAAAPLQVKKIYEDRPSYFQIDWNLWHQNPVIVRIRLPNGHTHFVVIVGKEGWDYLILDPGAGFKKGVYPLRELGVPIRGLRIYRHIDSE